MTIAIIDYGAGNVQSVLHALARLGYSGTLSRDAHYIRTAQHVIFPGVGHAGAAMARLRATGLDVLIPQLTQPVLGICVGMQLMCQYSAEGDTTGLGIFDSRVLLLPPTHKVPHMGWNTTAFAEAADAERWGQQPASYHYYVHSYAATISAHTIATCQYAQPFSAVLRRDNFTGVQFHPEKSGAAGAALLQHFLNT